MSSGEEGKDGGGKSSVVDFKGNEVEKAAVVESIVEGCRLPVQMKSGELHVAEVKRVKITRVGRAKRTYKREFYVHYLDFNKRLDEWVTEDKLGLSHIIFPTKKTTTLAFNLVEMTSSCTISSENGQSTSSSPAPSVVVDSTKRSIKLTSSSSEVSGIVGNRADANKMTTEPGTSSSAPYSSSSDDVNRDIKNVPTIELGRSRMDCWYYSPFPSDFTGLDCVFFCEFCLKYFKTRKSLSGHSQKRCKKPHPPGNEIYRKGDLSFFEIDGQKHPEYVKNLSLLTKLFLDHKEVSGENLGEFLFYLLTRWDTHGFHIIGCFSKGKNCPKGYNLACLLTLPSYQRQGYGKLLIDFSYTLTKAEGKLGTPEKPLTDLGFISYKSYWSEKIVDILQQKSSRNARTQKENNGITIHEICQSSGMTSDDVISTLQTLDVVSYSEDGSPYFSLPNIRMRLSQRKKAATGGTTLNKMIKVDPACLRWSPKQNRLPEVEKNNEEC